VELIISLHLDRRPCPIRVYLHLLLQVDDTIKELIKVTHDSWSKLDQRECISKAETIQHDRQRDRYPSKEERGGQVKENIATHALLLWVRPASLERQQKCSIANCSWTSGVS
jgi:hypothetical protein